MSSRVLIRSKSLMLANCKETQRNLVLSLADNHLEMIFN